ncbi:chaperone modulatory protein CbpM [Aliiruegeria haliotis]|uniref:Chaperone modulatory protein CbpM n=1 Tax=Aliiruegeria haliotis TaxID=1280846 RepID=A0A2T0S052_9RHOB|nr:chaperone modulator CbpM [Aliiruegeria haliotis]PRY26780.1 chaperone modulatory protein CbpM [Aliiruegeria haliotis]
MKLLYTEEEILSSVGRVSRQQLSVWVDADLLRPVLHEDGPRFSRMDHARLELICDLCETFDLEEDALSVVLSLLDQLHGVRAEFRALAQAVAAEPEEVRERIAAALKQGD